MFAAPPPDKLFYTNAARVYNKRASFLPRVAAAHAIFDVIGGGLCFFGWPSGAGRKLYVTIIALSTRKSARRRASHYCFQ